MKNTKTIKTPAELRAVLSTELRRAQALPFSEQRAGTIMGLAGQISATFAEERFTALVPAMRHAKRKAKNGRRRRSKK